ncbi:hypothetical protein [Chrysiogenes arsenatis]|nr:hypothetical protein [Chrysiogenes arsenatis]
MSVDKIRRLCADGRLIGVDVGRGTKYRIMRYEVSEIERYIEENRQSH